MTSLSRYLASFDPDPLTHDERHKLRVADQPKAPKLFDQPVTYAEACVFIRNNHSHHLPPQGWKFGIAVNDGEKIVGVITVGRPVARHLDDGLTLEVTRNCTDGTKGAASKLYGLACRAVRALGYKRLITYTLDTEAGTSLDASQWRSLYKTAGGGWDRPNRHRIDTAPTGQKVLWEAPI